MLVGVIIVVVLVACVAGFGASWLVTSRAEASRPTTFDVFWEAWDWVEQDFYGPLPSPRERTYGAIRGVLATLGDPYTVFLEPQPAQREKERLQGFFGGIGAYIRRNEAGEIYLDPFRDGPAAQAGLRKGDVLISVDGTPITPEMGEDRVAELIRGPVGTSVVLEVRRDGKVLRFTVVRQEIQVPSAEWRVLEEAPQVGYMRISNFTDRTPQEVAEGLQELKAQGVQALVLDLRGNGGGLLQSAVAVADEFLDEGVVLYEQRRGRTEEVYRSHSGGAATDLPLAVLVNGQTASASEIVAGAVQDRGRGVLVGEKTYGKGSVQLIYPLSDGSSLHVTAAIWLTPNRHRLQGNGLVPDVEVAWQRG
ncbi:MAG: S41 family peptidase, partial [Chloroflexi bacterium]